MRSPRAVTTMLLAAGIWLFGGDHAKAAPANDHFDQRTPLTGVLTNVEVVFAGATHEAGEPAHGTMLASHSAWWTWTAPFHGELSLQGSGGIAAPIIAVYRGTSLATLTLVKNNNSFSGFVPDGELLLEVQAGETYQIAVDSPDLFPVPDIGELWLKLTPPPANDAFAGRFPLGSLPVLATGNSKVATIEPGEPSLFESAAHRSLWWSWTAAANERVVITNHSPTAMNATVFIGETLSNLQAIASSEMNYPTLTPIGGTLAFAATAGQTYQLRFDATVPAFAGDIRFSLTAIAPPANDDFAQRFTLDGTNLTVAADNVAALAEPGERRHYSMALGKSLWWTWTAPQSGRLMLDTIDNAHVRMMIYEGTVLTNLIRHAPESDPNSVVITDVVGGHTYQFVADPAHFPGTFRFRLNFEPRSRNDDFANRQILSGTSIIEPFRTTATGREPGEPKALKNAYGNSLWWSWTAPSDGLLVLDADAIIGVFTGDTLNRLRKLALEYGRVSLKVRAGVTHQIVVDAPESLGTRNLALNFYPTPANDSFTQPTLVVGTDVRFGGDTRAATGERREPKIHPRSRGEAVWYSWVAPANGQGMLATVISEFVPALGVYRKENSGALTRLTTTGGNQDSYAAGLTFPAEQGRTYLFGVDSMKFPDEAEWGAFELRLLFSTLRLLSPVDGASALAPEPVTFSITPPLAGVDGELAVVNYVRIYADGGWSQVATASNAPFSAVASNLPLGRAFYAALAETHDGLERFTSAHAFTVRPANDHFTNRLTKTGYNWQAEGSTDGASVERSEPSAGGGASVWFSWMAPSAGTVKLIFYFNNPAHRLTLHTGDSLRGLKSVKLKRKSTFNWEFTAVEGQTYHFAVRDSVKDVPEGQNKSFNLQLETISFAITSPTNGAVLHEPLNLPLNVSMTENAASILRVEYLAGTNLIAASTAAPYSAVWSNASPGAHTLTARLVKSSGESPTSPAVQITIRPRNDSFANATILTGTDLRVQQNTRAATREPGEPDHANYHWPQSTWWKWTAPEDGLLHLELAPVPSGVAVPMVVVYLGESLTGLSGVSRTNFILIPGIIEPPSKEIAVDVVAGRTYSIVSSEPVGSDLDFTLTFRPHPANDRFESSIRLAESPTQLSGWTVLAEPQPGGPLPEGTKAVWWTWQAPTNGLVRLTTVMLPGALNATVFTGSDFGALQPVEMLQIPPVVFSAAWRTIPPRNPGGSTPAQPMLTNFTSFNVRSGEDYHIAITDAAGGTLGFSIDLQFDPGPLNDDFTAALPLDGTPLTFTVTNTNAGNEPGEPAHGSHTVWYSWTAPVTGLLRISNLATNPALSAFVYSGETLERLELAPAVPTGAGHKVQAGRRYHIAIATQRGSFGTFPCSLEVADMAGNDDFAARTAVDGVSVELNAPLPATSEAGEPAPVFPYHLPPFEFGSVWWSWTAPRSGRAEVVFTGDRYAYAVAVYEGDQLSNLRRVPATRMNDGDVFDAVGGRVYQIAGYANFSAGPEFRGRIELPVQPPNDFFTNRTVLHGEQVSITATNFGATVETGEPGFFVTPFGRTLWYSWQAQRDGLWVITNASPEFPIVFRVFVGPDFGHLTNRIVAGTRAELPAAQGTTFHFSVDGSFGQGGVLSFGTDFQPSASLIPAFVAASGKSAPAPQPLRISFNGEPGALYRIDTSTNLIDWVPLSTNRLESATGIITEREPGQWPARFYRILLLED